jgi:uncharacterized Fe-S cluster protein YjdI/CDGSH-type Zn-finger protein
MATRQYVGDGIIVHWDSDRCFHSERCTAGLPTVFDRAGRPWVHLDGTAADRVAAVIDTCPSGALSYTRTDGAANGRRGRGIDEDPTASTAVDPEWEPAAAPPLAGAAVVITPLRNGPLSVVGPVAIARPDGTVEVSSRCELCRCGHSGSKPLCDGSHARVGFTDPGAPSPSDRR